MPMSLTATLPSRLGGTEAACGRAVGPSVPGVRTEGLAEGIVLHDPSGFSLCVVRNETWAGAALARAANAFAFEFLVFGECYHA